VRVLVLGAEGGGCRLVEAGKVVVGDVDEFKARVRAGGGVLVGPLGDPRGVAPGSQAADDDGDSDHARLLFIEV